MEIGPEQESSPSGVVSPRFLGVGQGKEENSRGPPIDCLGRMAWPF